MLRKFWKLAPYFVVEWLSKKLCERWDVHGRQWASPWKGAMFLVDDADKKEGE